MDVLMWLWKYFCSNRYSTTVVQKKVFQVRPVVWCLPKMCCSKREIQDLLRGHLPYAALRSFNPNRFQRDFAIIGPAKTPFAGGVFLFSLTYNSRYPAEPPQAFFETPIYHPNVSCLGVVGLDLLLWMWSPEIRMKNILERLVCRLERPDMRCTWNVHATTVFLHNNAEFHSTASEWTKVFAKKQTLTQINQWRIIRDIMKKMQLFYSCWFFKK